MSYLSMMTDDEIQYVCSVIPISDSVGYFKRNPKDFSKIMPGFRPARLKDKNQVNGILFRNRNQQFISTFIENYISDQVVKINDTLSDKIDGGVSQETALLQTLSHSFFIDNIGLYFKLEGKEYSEEVISLFSSSIHLIKAAAMEYACLESSLNDKVSEVNHKELTLERVKAELDKTKRTLTECFDEIASLKRTNIDLEKLNDVIKENERIIEGQKQKAQEYEDYIQKLNYDLSMVKNE